LNKNPKILILYDYYVPAYKAGGPVQSLANMVELLGSDLDFYVLTGSTDLDENKSMDGIVQDEWVQVGKARVYYASKRSIAVVDDVISIVNPDIIYLNGMFSLPFMVYPVLKYAKKRKLILAPRGMLAPTALNIKKWKKTPYLFFLRLLNLHRKVTFHATKIAEEKEIKKIFSSVKSVSEIGNVPFPPLDGFTNPPMSLETLHIFTVARISPEKNVHFIFDVLQGYQGSRKIMLHLIGNPENEGYYLACLDADKNLPDSIKVNWIGHLDQPEIRSKIRDYHLFILPTLGENFGHAIFEAMGAGKPVLISNQTPWYGLEKAKAGFVLSLDDPEIWLKKIYFFTEMDEKTYSDWSNGAWNFARNYYDNLNLKEKYLEMFSVDS